MKWMIKWTTIAAVLVLCLAFFVIGRGTNEHKWSQAPAEHDWSLAPAINEAEPYTVWVPTPSQLQLIVGVKPDGIIGPETMRAWEEYGNNYNGVQVCLEAGM